MFTAKRIAVGLTLLISTNVMAQTFKGELKVYIADDFSSHKSSSMYQLKEGNELFTLDIPSSVNKKNLLTGQKVIIDGTETSSAPQDPNAEPVKMIIVNSITQTQIKPLALIPQIKSVDNRKVLSLIVNFTDFKTSNDVSIDAVDSILYTSWLSTSRNIQRGSFGLVNFVRTNMKGKPPIMIVNLNYPLSKTCDYGTWESDAKASAIQAGVNLNDFRHIMLVLPSTIACNWGGLGNLGCGTTCTTWIRGYDPKNVYSQVIYTHELGHNLGMHHSSTDLNNDGQTDSEYGDSACIMGTGDFQYYSEINAAHRDQMGWYANIPNRVKMVTTDGQFTLSPLEANLDNNGLIVLKIPRSNSETYYVSYRKNIGPFGYGDPNYTDKVSIHRVVSGDLHTYFIKKLKAGESFIDTRANITITADKTSDIAVVTVKK